MGFRSKMLTDDSSGIEVPDWFLSKYPKLNYGQNLRTRVLSISDAYERKYYRPFNEEEVFVDLQKILIEKELTIGLDVVLLHECGGISLVKITREKIAGMEPVQWKEVQSVEHDYCYGCTELPATPTNLE